jgi:hypothetical protein
MIPQPELDQLRLKKSIPGLVVEGKEQPGMAGTVGMVRGQEDIAPLPALAPQGLAESRWPFKALMKGL